MPSLYFTEEHQLFRQTVRDYFAREVSPYFDEWEAKREIPRTAWHGLGTMGFLGLDHREADGGTEADFFFSVIFLEELGRLGNGGFSTAISVHSYMATNHLASAGSEFLRQPFLRPALEGKKIAALAISEPAAGSDVSSLRTTARREGDHFVVSGGKNFISNGYYADFLVTAVRSEAGISLLLIEGNCLGVTRTKLNKIGWHSSDTAEIGFDEVRVPVDHLIGEEGKGFKYIMESFQLERLAAGILAVGGMEGALALTLRYMHEREAFGRPISKYQALRHTIAELATEVECTKQFVYHTAWQHAQGAYVVKECSMVKLKASELANRVVDRCLQMFGGYGYIEEYPIARMYRDSRVGTIAGGTSEIMKEIIAKMVLDDRRYDPAYEPPGKNGSTSTAAEIVASLPQRFRPEKANGYATVMHYQLSGAGGGPFTIRISQGHCELQSGLHGQASCVVKVAAADYAALETGRLDPQTAFMQGKLQVSHPGELMRFTQVFEKWKGKE